MPSLTATAHQVIRYFFVGAIAASLFLFLMGKPTRATWLDQARGTVQQLETPGAVVAMLIVGILLYGVHRVVFYPVLYRLVALTVWWPEREATATWVVPWGTALPQERRLETRMANVADRDHSRFLGWASEVHLYYLALEIALFTLYWPGWHLELGCWWWTPGFALLVLVVAVCAWDRHMLLLEDNATGSATAPWVDPTSC